MARPHLVHLVLVPLVLAAGACSDDTERDDADVSLDGDTSDPDGDTSDPGDSTADTDDNGDTGPLDTTETSDTSDAGDTHDTADITDTTDTRDANDVAPGEWPWPLEAVTVPSSPTWKARVVFPEEPFLAPATSYDPPSPRWVKFTVLTADPTRVYFQNTTDLPQHVDFAAAHLPGFEGVSAAELDALTLPHDGKKALVGALWYAPFVYGSGALANEVGIQIESHDPLPAHVVVTVLQLVRDAIDVDGAGGALTTFYLPVRHQTEHAAADAAAFEDAGFPLSHPRRWFAGDVCHTPGWAVGTIVPVEGSLTAAWLAGDVGPRDIALVSTTPDVVPPIAGVVSLAPSSPLAEPPRIAGAAAVPFVVALTQDARAALADSVGEPTALRAVPRYGFGSAAQCVLTLQDVSAVDAPDLAQLQALQAPAPLDVPARGTPTTLVRDPAELAPVDATTFGGASVAFGYLRRALPEASPRAAAISFALFDHLRAAAAPTGGTVGDVLDALDGATWPPADHTAATALRTKLVAAELAVRGAPLAPADVTALRDALAALGGEDTLVTLRASTNLHGLATFAPDALYPSVQVCVADDLDGDAAGPSHCDPESELELGVADGVRRVLAGHYGEGAFVARARRGVVEADVGVGLVAFVTPRDGDVRARGVAESSWYGDSSQHHRFVTEQVVPDLASIDPEVVTGDVYSFGAYFYDVQFSDLGPVGAHVFAWDAGYKSLADHAAAIIAAWRKDHDGDQLQQLAFDYRLRADGGLVVDGLRRAVPPDATTELTSFLLPLAGAGESASLARCTFQGEAGTLFGNHRNKATFELTNAPTFLDAAAREAGFYTDIVVTLSGGRRVAGPPSTLPGAFHEAPVRGEYDWSPRVDGFVLGSGENAVEYAIQTNLPWIATPASSPLAFLAEGTFSMTSEYATPQYDPEYWDGELVTSDYIQLGRCPDDEVVTQANPVKTHLVVRGDVQVDIRFWYPPVPTGAVAGYTAWLAKWDRTVITGLTTDPITLRGYWSQTFRPGHHNFEESFLFEPALEEGISEAQLAELEARDVRLVYVIAGFDRGVVKLIGADGKVRELP